MSVFISIITPVFNEEKHIAKCLASLVEQDYDSTQYEILVVDGMSTDQTREIVTDFAKKYNNIKLFDNPNRTAPYALNIGLKHAKGDVIIRVDGHAIVQKNHLSLCIEYLQQTNVECVGGVIESINDTKLGKAIAMAMSSPFGVGNARFRTSSHMEGYVDTLAFGAYRQEVFKKIGVFDEEFERNQDDEFNYRLRKAGGKIYLTPKIKIYYYPRASIRKLWKQYFQYGFWKVRVMQKHLEMMQIRQFIPALFILAILASLMIGIFYRPFFWVFLTICVSYISLSFYSSLKISFVKKIDYLPLLPAIFACLHFSYGIGFYFGLLRFAKYWIGRRA
ncbi:MAG: glycosyltransferase family 2 protein [candidate division KSB1 bacterium]|nr:glycosyltransferase family 2 protein [candidate division KSB1 bacterium]MDZ7336507.1 glycosyltransferase family 2 protein [candidate division KSB1 bacterium]MDZ7341275.1 glycosyltransferase family 2 protein [candidate division KSB1 bacterium]